MPLPVAVRRGAELGLRVAARLSFLAPLLTRLVIGYGFFASGRGKLADPDKIVTFFTQLGIPMPELNAAFVSRVEYYGGALLMLGLLTRLAASLLGSTMIVALMTADKENFLKALSGAEDVGLTDVLPVMWGMYLLWLLLSGPGLISLDALLSRRLGLGAPPKDAPAA
jgi:putative oxidoreductase